MNYYSRNNNNKQNSNSKAKSAQTANFPSQAPTANFPSQAPAANFPSQAPTAKFPSQAPTANFPSQAPAANFPSQAPTANFPSQAPTANFPSQAPQKPTVPNFPSQQATTRPTTNQTVVNQKPAQNIFKPPSGQISIEKSKGPLQTVQAVPATGSADSVKPCTDCSPEDAGFVISSVITGLAAGVPEIIEHIADVITVPAAVSGGTTDAVTLPAPAPAPASSVAPSSSFAPSNDYKACLANFPLAMCYVPMQKWETPYKEDVGFQTGTIFPSLTFKFDAEKGCAVK
jgi:hypothetical protein